MHMFYELQAEQHPGWLKEAREGEHTPETVEYGISSITFRSRRPFNMQRFNELKIAMEKRHYLHGGATHIYLIKYSSVKNTIKLLVV